MSPQEDSENPPGNDHPLSAGVDVGNHDDDLDLDTPPQTAALLSHKFHPYRHTHTHHHPLHTHHLQAAVTVHSVDAECWSSVWRCSSCQGGNSFFLLKTIKKKKTLVCHKQHPVDTVRMEGQKSLSLTPPWTHNAIEWIFSLIWVLRPFYGFTVTPFYSPI